MIAKRERNEARGFAMEYEAEEGWLHFLEMQEQIDALMSEVLRQRDAYAELLRGEHG